MIKLKNLITEKQFKGLEGIPANKKLTQISDAEKIKIVQASGNIIDFKVPDWAKGTRNFWQVISTGSIKKKKNLGGDTVYVLPGKIIQSPAYSSLKELLNGVNWESMEERRRFNESINEAEMNPVKKVVNAILKKHGVNAMKTTSTSVRGFHNIVNNGYSYDGNNFLRFYKVSPDVVEKVADEIQKAGVRVYSVNKSGTIKGDFSKTGLNEAAFKSPDFIVTSIPADAIPPVNISKADVGLGLSMGDEFGMYSTLNNKHYKLDYHNGKVALVLSKVGKLAVRIRSEIDPKYLAKIEKFVNDYLSKYAKEIKK